MTSVASALRSAGLRRTHVREAVLGAIIERGAPLTHADLVAHPALSGEDGVTLYRTLHALVDARLVHQVPGVDGTWRYCPQPVGTGCPGGHPHFLCTTCGQMLCLPDQALPHVAVPEGTRVHGRYSLAYGTCPRCAG